MLLDDVGYIQITTEDRMIEYLNSIDPDKLLFYDLETTSLIEDEAEILCHGFYQEGIPAASLFESDNGIFDGVPSDVIKKHLIPILENYRIAGHNIKYDALVCEYNGYPLVNVVEDTIVMCHLYDTEQRKNLEIRVKEDLGIPKKKFEDVVGISFARIKWAEHTKPSIDKKTKKEVPPKITPFDLGYYCAEDVYCTKLLHDYYEPLLKEWKLDRLYKEIEIPLLRVLIDCHKRGVTINREELKQQKVVLEDKLAQIELAIYEEAGYEFNINSGQQKAEVLYNKMGLPVYGTTNKGAYSTDAKALKKLSEDGHKIADLLLEYAKFSKILSTYVNGILSKTEKKSLIRPSFNSTGTASLRFSSSSPNLQNLANDPDNQDYAIRKSFIPRDGYKMIFCDYSAQEYAIVAHACKDPNMLDIFERGEDIHQWVADRAGVTRKQAKGIGFGILYGLGDNNLSITLKTDLAGAAKLKKLYFDQFPKLKPWIEKTEQFVHKNLYVRTPVGAVRRFPNLRKNNMERAFALRAAVNTCVQGSAAIQMKMAMVKIHRAFKEENLDAHILMTVHDELGVEAAYHHIERACQLVQLHMETALKLKARFWAIPNVVDNYGEGKDDSHNQREKFKNYKKQDPLWQTQMLLLSY